MKPAFPNHIFQGFPPATQQGHDVKGSLETESSSAGFPGLVLGLVLGVWFWVDYDGELSMVPRNQSAHLGKLPDCCLLCCGGGNDLEQISAMQTNFDEYSEDDRERLSKLLTTAVSASLARLLTQSPPHQILACLSCAVDFGGGPLPDDFVEVPLEELASRLREVSASELRLPHIELAAWLKPVIPNLAAEFGAFIHEKNHRVKETLGALSSRRVGSTKLSDYDKSSDKLVAGSEPRPRTVNLASWASNILDLPLVAAAQDGDTQAFELLYERHNGAVRGSISVRVGSDADAKDVSQKTWMSLWERIQHFNPSRGNFVSFAKYWAAIMVLRHYAERDRRRRFELLIGDYAITYPEIVDEDEIGKLWQKLSNESEPPKPENDLPDAILDRLLELIFRSGGEPVNCFSFGYVKMLHWRPAGVVAELSGTRFDKLFCHFCGSLLAPFGLSRERAEADLAPLREKVRAPAVGKANFKKHFTYPNPIRMKHNQPMSEAEQNADDITKWWHTALRRIRVGLERAGQPFAEMLREYL